MLKEEYQKLIHMLEQEPAKVDLEAVLKEAVIFFEMLRKEFLEAKEDDRTEIIHMMRSLHKTLQDVSKVTAEMSGMTEEELNDYASNPDNFSPEQWQLVQKTRREMYDSARKFTSALEKEKQTPHLNDVPKAPKKKAALPRRRRSKRKDWLQS